MGNSIINNTIERYDIKLDLWKKIYVNFKEDI